MASKKISVCSCVEHGSFSKGKQTKLTKLSSKKIKVSTIAFMKEEGLLPLHASTLCDACKDYVENMHEHTINLTSTKRRKMDECSAVVEKIENGELNDIELVKIVQAIGKRISESVFQDATCISNDYLSADFMEGFSLKSWLNRRNQILLNFLMYSASVTSLENQKKSLCLLGCINSLYKARVLNTVSPIPFYTNLITYYISGSSSLARLNCTFSPAGSYTCLKNWLKKHSSTPIKKPAIENDNVTFLDNNQVISRNWRVTFNHKTTASVITNIIHIEPSHQGNIQCMSRFNPCFWLYNDRNSPDTVEKIKAIVVKSDSNYNNIRDQYVANRMKMVQMEQLQINETLQDAIDRNLNDGVHPSLTKSEPDPYSWVESQHQETPPSITVGEPCMANPCSFQAVKKVFAHIQQQCGVGHGKEWTVVGCDGLPYSLGQKLLNQPENADLRNLLLIPGNGHIEINGTRALFKLLWDVALEDLAKLHGFRSPRALISARNCSDHHKSWQLLSVFLFGSLDEIIRQFLLSCNRGNVVASVSNLYEYISQSPSPNYRFMCDIIFNYVLALFVFRAGVRRGNYKVMLAGRNKVLKLCFGLNMTTYQSITFHDLKLRALAPAEVSDFLEKNESFSVSGNKSKGEGGDFVLEAINGRTKRWLPPGAPTEEHWLQVCRNVDKLEQLRDKLYSEIGLERKSPQLYQRDLSTEIFQWRAHLRKSGYFQLNDNCTNSSHTSVSGINLDRDLVIFEKTCNENFKLYLENIKEGNEPGKGLNLTPIFVTRNDRENFHDIRKKTKAQISTMICELIKDIEEMGNVDEALVLERQWGKVKVGTKDALLQFYKEVVVAVQDASNEATTVFAGTVSGLNLTCASFEAVSTLNAIVDTLSGFLQDIQTNSSIPMHERMSMILDTICNDLVLRKLVNGIAEDIAECPELILQSDLTSLELGPLSFLDLLETFESVDHVCECVDPLAQVIAIEDIRQDIIYENAALMAVFPEVINLNVICMKTSPPPRVNFTEAMLVIIEQEEQCQAVFQHSTMDILRMEDFILNKCDSFIAEDFSCALNYAHDQEFNNCLKRVSDKMIKDLEDPKCGRVTKSMADCEENGRNSYMQSVNIYEGQPQFQLSEQVCENSATSFASSFNWILLSSLISVLHP